MRLFFTQVTAVVYTFLTLAFLPNHYFATVFTYLPAPHKYAWDNCHKIKSMNPRKSEPYKIFCINHNLQSQMGVNGWLFHLVINCWSTPMAQHVTNISFSDSHLWSTTDTWQSCKELPSIYTWRRDATVLLRAPSSPCLFVLVTRHDPIHLYKGVSGRRMKNLIRLEPTQTSLDKKKRSF